MNIALAISMMACGSSLSDHWRTHSIADEHGVRVLLAPPALAEVPKRAPGKTRATGGGRRGADGDATMWTGLGPFGGDVYDIGAFPADESILLAGVAPGGGRGGALYRSTDGGANWRVVSDLDGKSVFDIEFDGFGYAYAASQDGLWRSADMGETWDQLPLGIGVNDQIMDVEIHPSNDNIVMVGVSDELGGQAFNVLRTTDGGDFWQNVTPPMGMPLSGRSIAMDPSQPNHVAVGFGNEFGDGAVWVSTDGGNTWADRSAGLPEAAVHALEFSNGTLYVGGGTLLGALEFGVFASTDLGATWTAFHNQTWPARYVRDIEVDPADPSLMLVASPTLGVFSTSDGGVTWGFGTGQTASYSVNAIRLVSADGQRTMIGTESHGVLESSFKTAPFVSSSNGIGALNVMSVASNPMNPDELALAFQGLNDGGVYTSLDRGQTWLLEPTPATRYNLVRYAPDGTLYALSDGPTTVAPDGVYRRQPNGSWTGIGPSQSVLFDVELFAIEFSPLDPNLVLVAGSDFRCRRS